jgi:hypothetical protein
VYEFDFLPSLCVSRTCIFTSVTRQYAAKARVLGDTLRRHQPDAFRVLVCVGDIPVASGDPLPFDAILTLADLALPNLQQLCFKYNVTELCTAVKPAAALHIMEAFTADRVLYLDPDIAVFDTLAPLTSALDQTSILLTPHMLEPELDRRFIVGGEVLFLKRGVFNLGFFGVRNDHTGRQFLSWWHDRLMDYCLDDAEELHAVQAQYELLGLFTDQKWVDLVPSLFERYMVVRDPGCNVATWNLARRTVSRDAQGRWLVSGAPLRFFHFSGVDSGAHREVLDLVVHVNPEARRAYEISDWYLKAIREAGDEACGMLPYTYRTYHDGTDIPAAHRRLYAVDQSARDRFPDPFRTDSAPCFRDWATERLSVAGMARTTRTHARRRWLRRTRLARLILRTPWLHRALLFLVERSGWR